MKWRSKRPQPTSRELLAWSCSSTQPSLPAQAIPASTVSTRRSRLNQECVNLDMDFSRARLEALVEEHQNILALLEAGDRDGFLKAQAAYAKSR